MMNTHEFDTRAHACVYTKDASLGKSNGWSIDDFSG